MLQNNPTDIDANMVSDLSYWVRRATSKREAGGESHFTYKGAGLVIHPRRAAKLTRDQRTVFVDDDSYTGRGWLDRFVGDIESAIATLEQGGGEEEEPPLGALLREEIARREAGVQPEGLDRSWWQWLKDDELPLLLGSWLHRVGSVSLRYEITRKPLLGFYPTNEEFELGVRACQSDVLWVTLQRLSIERAQVAKCQAGGAA